MTSTALKPSNQVHRLLLKVPSTRRTKGNVDVEYLNDKYRIELEYYKYKIQRDQ